MPDERRPGVPPFTVLINEPVPPRRPMDLVPVYEAEATRIGDDLFDAGTRKVRIIDGPGVLKFCLLFIPSAVSPDKNKVHVCWSPGDEIAEALTGAFRFASNSTDWILLMMEGADPGAVTLSAAELIEILRKAGRPAQIDALRLSCHSRGYRGLANTLDQDLLVQRKGAVIPPKVSPNVVGRVINFDAYYFDFFKSMNASGIPSSKIFGYRVTVPSSGKPALGYWSASSSQTIDLGTVLNGVRAVMYSRLIQDSITIGRRSQNLPGTWTLSDITGRLLQNLPPLGQFSSRSSPADFRLFCKTNAQAIMHCLRDEQNIDLDHAGKGPLIEFVNLNDLAGMRDKDGNGGAFTAAIWAHQLFACEFSHEVTDGPDPQP